MRETKIIAVILGICACVAASSVKAATIPAGTTLTVSTVSAFSSKTVVGRSFRGETRSGRLGQWTRSIESWKQSIRKDRVVSLQSAQKRSADSGTHLRLGERPQRRCENECVPAGKPADDGASGAVWSYSRHVSDYPRHRYAVPATSTSHVVTAASPTVDDDHRSPLQKQGSAKATPAFCRSQRAACVTVVGEAVGSPRFRRRIRSSSAMVCGSWHAP